jgi:aquaporin Z
MRKYVAEAVGTFAVVFTGVGALAIGGARLGDAGVALAFGLAVAAMTLVLSPLSGAHMNPAVTVAMAIAGRLPARDVAPYAAAQLAGGSAGAALVITMANSRPGGAPLAASSIANGFDRLSPGFYGIQAALIAEIALTALFVLVVLGTSERWGASAGGSISGASAHAASRSNVAASALAAGLAYAMIHLVGLPVTKMAANPARALGPALFAGGAALDQVWLFLTAPLAGAIIAAAVYRVLYGAPRPALAERIS